MVRKELNIKVVLEGNQVGTIVQRKGFTNDLSGTFEVIGILENILEIEKEKVKIARQASMKGGGK
jgi:hypothetical protein